MRRTAVVAALSALALLPVACVPSSQVPSTVLPPGAPAGAGAQPLSANPQAVTTSLSAVTPPYPSISVSEPGAGSPPYLIAAQSTCLTNGEFPLIASAANGTTATFQFAAAATGQCVLVFGGQQGITLIVPVTITP